MSNNGSTTYVICRVCGDIADDARNIFVNVDGNDDNLLEKLQTTFSIVVSG